MKTYRKTLIVFSIGMLSLSLVYGQGMTSIALKIGDKLPDLTISEFKNYKSKTAKLSDFKGKLVILDFWNRWCGSCIRSFPHMEKLQEQFGNQIAILLVTDDPMDAFEKLQERSPTLQSTKLPFVIGDSILHALFPHKTVPYHVWIDPEGKVKAMTNGSNATVSHIQDVLDGKDVVLLTREAQLDFNTKAPLLEEGNGRQLKHLEYYSLIMHRLHNKVGSGVILDSSVRLVGLKNGNSSIIDLYENAFGFIGKYSNGAGKVVVESNKLDKYYPPSDKGQLDEWQMANTFCYESRFPLFLLATFKEKRMEKLKEMMRQDLDRFFQIKSGIETRNEKCLILYRINNQDKLKTKIKERLTSDGYINDVIEKTRNNGYIFKNTNFVVIPNSIRYANSTGPHAIPLIDETNYKGQIDATLDCDFSNIPKLKIELAKYGLGLKEEIRPVTCLVLREIGVNN